MSKIALYPGTFDPITLGHVDLIQRAATLFDKVLVAVAHSARKKPLFDIDARVALCKASLQYSNIEVIVLDGLLVDMAKLHGVDCIVRGMRSGDDVAYEFDNAHMNRQLSGGQLETLILPASSDYAYVSATMVREIIALNGDASAFVPQAVVKFLASSNAQ